MKALVTGATGFVGSWLTRALCERGIKVRVICRNPELAGSLRNLPVELVPGDVTQPESLDRACQEIHSVFHLAGVVGYSRAMRPLMNQVNVDGTKNMVEAALRNNVQRFVHMSSVVAIGASFDGKPLNENSPYNIEHLNLGYFETKRLAEALVSEVTLRRGLNAVILNPSTIYGAGDATKGSRKTQIKVAQGKFPFYTSGGVNVIAVEDVIAGILAAWEKGQRGERYILAGENLTIKDLFAMIAAEAGVNPPGIYLPNFAVHTLGKIGDGLEAIGRKGPINSENAWTSTLYHWFDSSKAQRSLGLKPRPARQAIAASVRWMKENHVI
ncbi:MAG: SDR family oxidoreductase [Bdellovibrionales bacterium]|nr:SDR family oxidoreductase [Bdellovibrionales bacterium]